MQDQHIHDHHPVPQKPRSRSIPVGILAGLSAVVLATGGATAWWTWSSHQQNMARQAVPTLPGTTRSDLTTGAEKPDSSQIGAGSPTDTSKGEPSTVKAPVEQTVQVYWVKDTGTRLELVSAPVTVQAEQGPEGTLKAALTELLKGPSSAEVVSTIPEATQVRRVEVRSDGVHVDLSDDFALGGGSASMMGRLGQIIYTASSVDPNANVWITVEGEPLEVLGGEGLIVDQPMTRRDFDANFPL